MRDARLRAGLTAAAALVACGALTQTAAGLALDVPGTHPTLQAAVAAAAVSPDLDNTISISVSPVSTTLSVDIGAAFGPARRLTIRPGGTLARASVINTNPTVPIFNLSSAANVTLQDLDILRNVTNGHHLIVLTACEDVVIERCRIGSNWPVTGTAGWANVYLTYPTDITLRNNILFARTPGTFDYGIRAANFSDPANALRLYHNAVADYRIYGVRIEAGVVGSLVLLRNNVVANHPSLAPEPVAYRSEVVVPGSTVVTSHNVAYAGAAFVQTGLVGAAGIAGLPSSFLNFAKAAVVPSFVATTWTMAPPWDANPGFYHLVAGGPLHDDAGDYGFTVTNLSPDLAVVDDIDREIRPGGPGPHVDRGPDQVEPGAASTVASAGADERRLSAVARPLPGGGLEFAYRGGRAGRLEVQIFDVRGRKLHAAGRPVGPDAAGVVTWSGGSARASGMIFYRVRLSPLDGQAEEVSGKVLLLR